MMDLYYIEDDPNIALAVKEYLEPKNFHVTICTTLAEARQRIKDHVPACVLLDWNMPDGRGVFETAVGVRRRIFLRQNGRKQARLQRLGTSHIEIARRQRRACGDKRNVQTGVRGRISGRQSRTGGHNFGVYAGEFSCRRRKAGNLRVQGQ